MRSLRNRLSLKKGVLHFNFQMYKLYHIISKCTGVLSTFICLSNGSAIHNCSLRWNNRVLSYRIVCNKNKIIGCQGCGVAQWESEWTLGFNSQYTNDKFYISGTLQENDKMLNLTFLGLLELRISTSFAEKWEELENINIK